MISVSIIIPVKPGGAVKALTMLQGLRYPPENVEVLVAEGCQPSRQRNAAAREAAGEILYFLDDDSLVDPGALQRLDGHYGTASVVAVGGPSLTPSSDSYFQRAIGAVLASPVGGGGVRNRYRQHGECRSTTDDELILCNLSFRKHAYLAAGGLDERLYPNEENELMDRLLADGQTLLHDPALAVYRSQRATLRLFIRQFITYGRGRAEQTRLSRKVKVTSLLPAAFVLYLLGCLAFPVGPLLLPLFFYCSVVLGAAAGIWLTGGCAVLALWSLLLIPLMHVTYGAGLLVGFLRPRYRMTSSRVGAITVRREKSLGQSWGDR